MNSTEQNEVLALALSLFPVLSSTKLEIKNVVEVPGNDPEKLGTYVCPFRIEQATIYLRHDAIPLILAHELGHFAYDVLFRREADKLGQYVIKYPEVRAMGPGWEAMANAGSEVAAAILVFNKAVARTAVYENLYSLPVHADEDLDKRYALSAAENWANAFAQYLAMQNSSGILFENLSEQIADIPAAATLWETNGYWPIKDFQEANLGQIISGCIS